MAIFKYDVVIVGASFGGVAAALAAADEGASVALFEETDWVGGQATSQGVTRWDEASAAVTESTGSPRSYRDLRDLIRAEYAGVRSAMGLEQEHFNPGFAGVGPSFATSDGQRAGHSFAADPQVVRRVLMRLLDAAGISLTFGARILKANVNDGAIQSLTVITPNGSDEITGRVYLDATDLGDLLWFSGAAWVIGAEAKSDTGEDQAEATAQPGWIQPITVPIALTRQDSGPPSAIPKPANYDYIRIHQGFTNVDGDISTVFESAGSGDTVWNYRQFIDPLNFNDGRPARTTINLGSNDYLARAIPGGPPYSSQDAAIVQEAREVSIAYLYYLQNDVPRDDGSGTGYKNLAIDTTAFGTEDGTAPSPYIRESRRLATAHRRVVQSDIDYSVHPLRARNFPDSCGIGNYTADVHRGWYSAFRDQNCKPVKAKAETPNIGTEYRNVRTSPFQVPLGALIPKELNNLVAACKNIGATHITSGAYRVHPVEWAIGEAAGVLASFCNSERLTPGDVVVSDDLTVAYQRRLLARGTPIFWWSDVRFERDRRAFAAIQLLGVRGVFQGDGETLAFDPDGEFPQVARNAMDRQQKRSFNWPGRPLTRAEAAVLICEQSGLLD
ncbi:MAG: FAD-dependent oxidoreductase [Candidatus Cybelea sp.]